MSVPGAKEIKTDDSVGIRKSHYLFNFKKEGKMIRKDIYQLLGISKKAPAGLVKKAFRQFAKDNHPDFFPGDKVREERFKKVTSAYQSWKLIQNAIKEITRIKSTSAPINSMGFKAWRFSWKA